MQLLERGALGADEAVAVHVVTRAADAHELGQVRGPRSDLYEALETATGAQDNPLSIVISTQAPNPTDLLSVLIDDALTGADPRVVVSLYTAPDSADPFDPETIRLANPAFGDFQNADEVIGMAPGHRGAGLCNELQQIPPADENARNIGKAIPAKLEKPEVQSNRGEPQLVITDGGRSVSK